MAIPGMAQLPYSTSLFSGALVLLRGQPTVLWVNE
jgi:hypothetical protein